jgi:guanylate kinase
MGKIFYIMGKSASGKDTIYERVLHREGLHLQRLVPYTTRPIRSNEMEGVEYHFVGEEKLQEFLRDEKVIELREYHTMHGIWKYFTVDDEYMDLKNKDYLAIGTLESYEKIRNYYGEEKIVPIYIEVEDGLRLERALQREKKQTQPKYEEMCRRFLADCQDFSEEKIQAAGIKVRFENERLDSCLLRIVQYIQMNR